MSAPAPPDREISPSAIGNGGCNFGDAHIRWSTDARPVFEVLVIFLKESGRNDNSPDPDSSWIFANSSRILCAATLR